MKEMVGGCCVCSDERGWPDNPLVYCDGNGCTVAVHQACYGIVTVPTGPWYCRKCESHETKGRVRCELCPSKSGALKRTDTNGWAHVVCALYIPEVRFGNVTSMEPIVLRLIPPERYNKTCYICQDMGKTARATVGACMQCNKSGCKQQFHVTCAQGLGLLCEEAGNYLDNVKYCGYCQHHYGKLPGRKSSHSSTVVSGKNTPSTSKTSTNTTQPTGGKYHHSSDKKKPSPSRRNSPTGDAGPSCSKSSTPALSPTHATEAIQPQGGKATTMNGGSNQASGAKATQPLASPGSNKPPETVGVISSVASANATSMSTVTTVPTTSVASTCVLHIPMPKTTYQESVITNTEAIEMKMTKKRKAMYAVNNPNTPVDYATTPSAAKTDAQDSAPATSHFSAVSPAPPPPPPPPAHSPASQPSPRHLPNPMPGPSGLCQFSNIRSTVQPQIGKSERDGPTSLLVSVPLPSISCGLNLSTHSQVQNIPLPPERSGPSQHIFHQPHKQITMEPSISGHSSHGVPGRTWGGMAVAYDMLDPNKPGMAAIPSTSKDIGVGGMVSMQTTNIRSKKQAAMASAMMNSIPCSAPATQTLASVRRHPQPTPPPVYQETIKDSPPSSPSSERPLKPKMELKFGTNCTAPHMLGNELNPASGAAACLQEQLSAELAAHAAGAGGSDVIVPPPLINRAAATNSSSSLGRGSSSAQSLDQLLERQWEQGSQFLMEQAQHFDIASLLSCLHQLRTENVRLEEHVGNLLQRRDHLLAVNARLAIPLTTGIYIYIGSPIGNAHLHL